MRRWPRRSSRRSLRQGLPPRCRPSKSSRPITRSPWRNSGASSSAHVTARCAPNGAIVQSTPRIASSRADSKRSGKALCRNSKPPKQSSRVANTRDPIPSRTRNAPRSSRSARISTACGLRPPRAIGIARNCCAHCSRRSLCALSAKSNAHLTLRWRGGLFCEIDVPLPRSHPAPIRTAEDTVDLLRRLAVYYPDAVIAGILNRQGRNTATGLSFTANRVGSLRTHWNIPCFEPSPQTSDAPCVTVERAAQALGVAPSTLHRWLNDGFIAGEQITPGAPWRIRLDDELRARFVEDVPEGYVTTLKATHLLSVSRQTILQRVKRGELHAVHVSCGRRKGLRIKLPVTHPDLFNTQSTD